MRLQVTARVEQTRGPVTKESSSASEVPCSSRPFSYSSRGTHPCDFGMLSRRRWSRSEVWAAWAMSRCLIISVSSVRHGPCTTTFLPFLVGELWCSVACFVYRVLLLQAHATPNAPICLALRIASWSAFNVVCCKIFSRIASIGKGVLSVFYSCFFIRYTFIPSLYYLLFYLPFYSAT